MNFQPFLPPRRFKGRHLALVVAVFAVLGAALYRWLPGEGRTPALLPQALRPVSEQPIDHPRLVVLLPQGEAFRAEAAMFRMGAELAARRLAAENVKVVVDLPDPAGQPLTPGERLSVAASNPDSALLVAPLPLAALSEVLPEAEKRGLLVVVPGNSHQKLADRSSVLPLAVSDRAEGSLAASVISGWAGDREALAICDPHPYGELLLAGFEEGAKKAGLKFRIVRLRKEEPASSEILREIRPEEDVSVWLAGPPDWAQAIAEVLSKDRRQGRYLFPSSCTRAFLDETLLVVPENFLFLGPAPSASARGETGREFRDAFVRSFLREPDQNACLGYDCIRWIGQALRERPLTRKSVRARLLAATGPDHPYDGLAGTFFFDDRGTTWNSFVPLSYRNGKFVASPERGN